MDEWSLTPVDCFNPLKGELLLRPVEIGFIFPPNAVFVSFKGPVSKIYNYIQ